MALDLTPIRNLNLHAAFGAESAVKKVLSDEDLFVELFEHSQRSSLFIFDDEIVGYSRYVDNTKGLGKDKTFFIENPNHKEVFLMRIDGVLFPGMSKCDCAVLYDNVILFVEFKTKAANKTEEAREYQYNKCYNQLKDTIQEFETRFLEIRDSLRGRFSSIEAIAVFNPTVPRDDATQKALRARFLIELRLKLSFLSKKEL